MSHSEQKQKVVFEVTLARLHGESLMLCPACGGDYLHHGVVEVYVRPQEDAPSTRHSVGYAATAIDHFGTNPSPRRNGLRIFFSCEQCSRSFALEIAQHKGQTYLQVLECEDSNPST